MTHRLVSVFVLALFTFYAERSPASTLIGAATSCENWTKLRKQEKDDTSKGKFTMGTALQLQWLMGYTSAVASAFYAAQDPLNGVDGTLLADWTDRYCATHPKDHTSGAGLDLLEAIEKANSKGEKTPRTPPGNTPEASPKK